MNMEYVNAILVISAIKSTLYKMGIKKLSPRFTDGKIEINGMLICLPENGTAVEKAGDILVDYFTRKITNTTSGLPQEVKSDKPLYNGATEYRKEEILALINQYRTLTDSSPVSGEAIHQDEIHSRRFFADVCQIGGFRSFKHESRDLFKRESDIIIVYGETQSMIWSFRLGMMGFFFCNQDPLRMKKTSFDMIYTKCEYVNDKSELELLFEKNIQEDKKLYLDSIRRHNRGVNSNTPQPYSNGSETITLPFTWHRTPFRF